ncbi:hypothetical protein WICMUC_005095 [Wickerhamomyces mucosus]|uniref:Cytosolic endo-beta-N-acetylglucosaminidase TIM barrel domain-containing protein n=1 Tax=Wickerhamomyces mucosus TaxID=1378264 RepID=A0A9P8PC80_9ASCO|nr:hypothetical protein WICMUC_005095 [Wickerhamomyces mucosus]
MVYNTESHFTASNNSKNLIYFTEALKSKLHSNIPDSKVVWYDSFISSENRIRYQNGVTELNYPHFDSSDLFFTNYWWDENNLKSNVSKIGFEGVKRKLFVGIDIWGRGSKVGNGGFETGLAMDLLRQYSSNIALFAPAWTYETAQSQEEFLNNDQTFWKNGVTNETPGGSVATFIQPRLTPVFTDSNGIFKFYTNFNQGEGKGFRIEGKSIFDDFWVNGSLQSYIPAILSKEYVEINKSDAFNGGSSLKIIHKTTKTFEDSSSKNLYKLFQFDQEIIQDFVELSFSYKSITELPKNSLFQIELTYYIERRYKTISKVREGVLAVPLSTKHQWKQINVSLAKPRLFQREHFILSGVQLRFVPDKSLDSLDSSWVMIPKLNSKTHEIYELLLGDLSIQTIESKTNPISFISKREVKGGEVVITWNDDYENVLYWLVYVNGKLETVSASASWVLNKTDRVRIDVFTRDGKVLKGSNLFV